MILIYLVLDKKIFRIYGARKVWLQMNREGAAIARCTVERLNEAGIHPSVGSPGDAYNHQWAVQNGGDPQAWPLEWVYWFNHLRLLESIGDMPSAKAEEQYYREIAMKSVATVLL